MLPVPVWGPNLSVGNDEIDEQHRKLLALGERAVALLDPESGSYAPAEFHSVLEQIVEQAEKHFATEEDVLTRRGCPNLVAHKAEHDGYIEMLADLVHQEMQDTQDKIGVLALLTEYLHRHLLETDMACREYFRDGGR